MSCSCCSPCAAIPISVGSERLARTGMRLFRYKSSKSWIWIYRPRAADTVPLSTTTIPARTPHDTSDRSTRGRQQRRASPLLSPSRLNNSQPTRPSPPVVSSATTGVRSPPIITRPKQRPETREAATRRGQCRPRPPHGRGREREGAELS